MSGDDALWGALSRAAVEAGRLVRQTAESAANELSGALGRDQMEWPSFGLAGPTIPKPYKASGQGLTWHDGYMASCALSIGRAVEQHRVQPATASLLALQTVLHFRPGGYRLQQVGLNSQRVLRHREWRRLGSSVLLHGDLPHLVSNCTSLVLEGLPLERRLGSAKLLALVASSGLATQGLYLMITRLAAEWLPRSGLASSYYSAYSVGFSGIAMALRVVGGYMREADLAVAGVEVPEEFVLTAGRLAAWPSLLLSHALVPNASLAGHLCGVAAGVLHVYAARAVAWAWRRLRGGGGQRRRVQGGRLRPAVAATPFDLGSARHPGLGWWDVGSHVLLGAGTCLVAHQMAARRGGGGMR